jgi:hypothetical protein
MMQQGHGADGGKGVVRYHAIVTKDAIWRLRTRRMLYGEKQVRVSLRLRYVTLRYVDSDLTHPVELNTSSL